MTRSSIPPVLLERYVLGEMSDAEQEAMAAALHRDPSLRDAVTTLQRDNRAILDRYPPHAVRAAIEERMRRAAHRRRTWTAVAATACLLVAALGVVTAQRTTAPDRPTAPYVGVKGVPLLHVYRKEKTSPRLLAPNDVVREGDVLQLRIDPAGATALVVVSVDGRGTLTVHYPTDGQSSPQGRITLPYSYQLDDAPKFERFFLFWRTDGRRLSVQDARRALRSYDAASPGLPPVPRGVHVRDFVLRKPR